MAKGYERIFENMTNWGHIINIVEAKISQESITFYIEEWWIGHNGPQCLTTMEAQMVMKALHEGPLAGHFAIELT
jgi:hypothetical protein